MDSKQKQKLKKFIKELDQIRGRHTELVSVYVPAGYELLKIIQHLQQEQGTASNIKDKNTRKNVIDSLERMIRYLRLFKKTPPNGLAVFAGNKSEKEGQADIDVWSIEPPEPIKTRMYRCDQTFQLDILREQIESKEVYGLLVIDNREANLGLLKGTTITEITKMDSMVPGKIKAGGQCLASDTLVQLNNGIIVPISGIHNPMAVKSFDFMREKFIDSGIIDFWKKNKEAYIIETAAPHISITTSSDHKFFVLRKGFATECATKELSKNDLLLMPEKISITTEPVLIDNTLNYEYKILDSGRKLIKDKRIKNNLFQKELAKKIGVSQTTISAIELGKTNLLKETLVKLCSSLGIDFYYFIHNHCEPTSSVKLPIILDRKCCQIAGYFIGDGNFENKDRLGFSEQDKEVADYYLRLIKEYFNTNVSIKFRENKSYYQLRVYGRPIIRFFRDNFAKKNALECSVPKNIMITPNSSIAGFLRGIFDAEGYVTKDEISLGMISKRIIYELHLLLLRFGILSSITIYNNQGNPYSKNFRYTLRICDKTSLSRFVREIGFTSSYKMEKARNLAIKRANVSRTRQVLCYGSEVRKILLQYGYKPKDFPKVSGFFRDKRPMSKLIFEKSIINKVKNKELKLILRKILDKPLIPVKIKSITNTGKIIPMNDISVNNFNFLAQGIVVHNSQARFSRLREEAAHNFYKKVGEAANKEFLPMKELKGIIVGGPGPTKEIFLDGNYLNTQLKNKVIGIKDLSYTGEFGLNELVDKSHDLLEKQEVTKEKQLVQRFFDMLNKEPEKTAYGKKEVEKAISMGAVDMLLISEDLEDSEIEDLQEKAEAIGAKIEIISIETREGAQLRDLGGIAAILRFQVS